MKAVHSQEFTDYAESIPRALETAGAADLLAGQRRVLIKPNLVNASPPPVTLPVAAAEALVVAVRRLCDAEVVIGEGTGDAGRETDEIFRIHGYDRLAERLDVPLVDLNHAPLLRLENPACRVFPEFMMPEIVMDSFLVSAAVLKAHSLAEVTLSMKNMLGCAPPAYYQQGGHWKKSAFHARMHEATLEMNRYRTPDLAFIDASVGLAEYHLGGPACDPPPRRILVGRDPVAVDAAGCALLGIDWRSVAHVRDADGLLGRAQA